MLKRMLEFIIYINFTQTMDVSLLKHLHAGIKVYLFNARKLA